jgi:hypothetical protein
LNAECGPQLPVVFRADEEQAAETVHAAESERLFGQQALELAALKKGLGMAGWGHDEWRRVVTHLADEEPRKMNPMSRLSSQLDVPMAPCGTGPPVTSV